MINKKLIIRKNGRRKSKLNDILKLFKASDHVEYLDLLLEMYCTRSKLNAGVF